MPTKKKYLTLNERTAYHRIEDVVGCKWSTSIIAAINENTRRPGELERYIPGISKKILSERLRKLTQFGLLTRHELPGKRPHVEYHLTPAGHQLSQILTQLQTIQNTLTTPKD